MPDEFERNGWLANFLTSQLNPKRLRIWRLAFFTVLGLIILLNLIIRTHHPHFVIDGYPLFWPAFGLVVGVIMIWLVKKIIQPLIKKTEDYYGDL